MHLAPVAGALAQPGTPLLVMRAEEVSLLKNASNVVLALFACLLLGRSRRIVHRPPFHCHDRCGRASRVLGIRQQRTILQWLDSNARHLARLPHSVDIRTRLGADRE
jgi:hypothetical protein